MQVEHQQAQEALCLAALRETASHVLNYGMWVAMTHLKTYMDIPPVAERCNRVLQSLQLSCDLATEHLDTHLASGQRRKQQYTRDDNTVVKATAEKLKAVQRSRRARIDNSQCMMWNSVCDGIKSASSQRTNRFQTSLLIVDAPALEVAFQIVSAAGLKVVQLLHAHMDTAKVGF